MEDFSTWTCWLKTDRMHCGSELNLYQAPVTKKKFHHCWPIKGTIKGDRGTVLALRVSGTVTKCLSF